MIFKNKIFLTFILLILLFLVFNFNNTVFGADNITFNGYCDNNEYTVPNFDSSDTTYDYNNGYIIYKDDSGNIYMSIYAFNDGIMYYHSTVEMLVSTTTLYNFTLDINSNVWVYTDTQVKGQSDFTWVKMNKVLYFSKNIYSDSSATSIYLSGRGCFFSNTDTGDSGTDNGSDSGNNEDSNLLNSIINWFKDLFNKTSDIFDKVKEGFENIGKWFSELGTDIGDWFKELGTNIGGFFTDLWNNIKTIPDSIWDLFKEGLLWLFVPEERLF